MNTNKFIQFAENVPFMGVLTLILISISLLTSNHYGSSVIESDLYQLQNQVSAERDLK